ncbi:MAG: SagB/ThcOx family dehydrogenase [Candidatus Nitrosocosmicus sp.]|nr:SagB/ThcOx family dehydrogenase [Candidatus Nitrosocosmicus sp.]MDN5868901.1 SagB/ThcOx family dehydrogenase [Candidatus Nitrosocosmicus sp.]
MDNNFESRIQNLVKSSLIPINIPNQFNLKYFNSAFSKLKGRESQLYDIAELFHENTKIRKYLAPEFIMSASLFDEDYIIESISRMERKIPTFANIPLPRSKLIKKPFSHAIRKRRSIREYEASKPLELNELSTLLYHSYGISAEMRTNFNQNIISKNLLTIPSGGGLYPLELYVGIVNGNNIDNGLYHYNYLKHHLDKILVKDFPNCLFSCFPIHPNGINMDTIGAVFIIVGIFLRSKMKYGSRSYRYVLQESGHLAQNLCVTATALNLGSIPIAAFFDDDVNKILNIDGVEEAAVYTVFTGHQKKNQGKT